MNKERITNTDNRNARVLQSPMRMASVGPKINPFAMAVTVLKGVKPTAVTKSTIASMNRKMAAGSLQTLLLRIITTMSKRFHTDATIRIKMYAAAIAGCVGEYGNSHIESFSRELFDSILQRYSHAHKLVPLCTHCTFIPQAFPVLADLIYTDSLRVCTDCCWVELPNSFMATDCSSLTRPGTATGVAIHPANHVPG